VHKSAQSLVAASLVFCAAAGLTAPLSAQANDAAALDSLRVALKKYQDPVAAIRDGYFSTLGCVTIAQAGGPGEMPYKPGSMGVHFLNMQMVSATPDPAHPPVLLYEPQGDKLVLVGAEWFVPLMTGVKQRPSLLGHPLQGPMAGHEPLMSADMSHYDLHVWLFKENPAGMFEPTNTNVKCTGYSYTFTEHPPKLVAEPKP